MPPAWTALAALVLSVVIPSSAAARTTDRQEPADRGSHRESVRPGDARRAEAVKVGWWWAANEPPPETGLLAAPQPPSPTVPKGAIPVGAVAGDPDKVAAIEVRLAAESGSSVRAFEMVLRENDVPGATTNAEAAQILACPVTELFWADGAAAAWKDRPSYDCELASAKGKRTENGLWRFDLSEVASGWLVEGSTASQSVVLVEDVTAPESFQVTFDGIKDKGVGLGLKADAPPAVPEGTPPAPAPESLGGGGGSPPLTASGPSLDSGGVDLAPLAADAPPVAGQQPAAGDETTQPAVSPVAAVAAVPAWYSGIPRAAFLLLPIALGLAYLVMLSLGPAGRPAPPATGRHGVSRALDRLAVGR